LIDKKLKENPKFSKAATDNTAMLELQRLIAEKESLRGQEQIDGIDLSKEIGLLHGKIADMKKANMEDNSSSKAYFEHAKTRIRNDIILAADIVYF
jgi:hypothetical protein